MTTLRTLNVNGHACRLAVEPYETLLDVLREKLNLTGTKKACNVGDCGACTVLVDGEPVNSCLTLAALLEGRSITTIEGLDTFTPQCATAVSAVAEHSAPSHCTQSSGTRLTPLQKAFIHEGAIQCGFCTPGMVLAATALLERNPNPTADEVKDALAGNLCRCTGYAGILRAVQRCENYRDDGSCDRNDAVCATAASAVARCSQSSDTLAASCEGTPAFAGAGSARRYEGEERTDRRNGRQLTCVGVSIPRVDAADKVTGRALYTADIKLPNMLHGKVLGSAVAHGIVRRIDVTKAAALPGVLAVITGADVPDTMYGVSPARYDEHVLARGVRASRPPRSATWATPSRPSRPSTSERPRRR